MLTESTSVESVTVDADGKMKARQVTVIMRDGVEIHRIVSTVPFSDPDEPASAEQAAVLPEVKARLAAAQGVIAKKEKPVPSKP